MNDDTPENPPENAAVSAPAGPAVDFSREVASDQAAKSPPPLKQIFSADAAPLLLGAFLLAALAAAGVYLAKRQLGREPGVAVEAASPAQSAAPGPTLDIPEPAGPPLAGDGQAPGKIFNQAIDGVKAGAAAIHSAAPSADGSIGALPPAPEAGEGNEALQHAAKDAAKRLAPKPQTAPEIDLSTGDGEAALETLEREAAAQPTPGFSPPPVAHAGAGIGEALTLDIARLAGSLETERQHTERQTAEIARLNSELAALKAQGSQQARTAKAALLFGALAEKARSGAPYRREFDDYARAAGGAPSPPLATGADAGISSLAALKLEFPGVRDAALAAARREGARGPIAHLRANLASLVRLRRAAPADGAGASAIFSRAEAKLYADDLDGAVADLGGLTGAARVQAAPWTQKASARVHADAALADINRTLVLVLEAEKIRR